MSLFSQNKAKNRYQLKEKLGTGGMGVVYRARDTAINADVALKTLNDITDSVALRLFREECDKLAKIVHPNVVEIRDVGEIEEGGLRKPYLVMPFLRGRTLDSLILDSPGGIPLERALEILVQACRGLQATHDAGLIHRDIKPSNIFVLDDDSVKLIDFGVAHYAEHLLTATRKGTLMYMAPEQVTMRGISPLSDIFSLGVVAYETLSGRRPFEGNTEKDLVETILQRNPPPASRFNPKLNSTVDQSLQKALAKLPESRFQSAREFGETLRKAVLNQRIAFFDPARIEARLEQARSAVSRGDLDLAGGIFNQLEQQGYLDERISAAKRDFERIRDQRTVVSLLASARARIEAQEYGLAAERVEEALRVDPQNAEAGALRKQIERQRAEHTVHELLTTARHAAGNREFERAKELVEEALGIWPNESAAVELRSDVQRWKQEFNGLVDEKRRGLRYAQQAMNDSEPGKALELIVRVIELDRQAPEAENSGSDLLKFRDRILAASQQADKYLAQAQAMYEAGDFTRALTCCDEMLGHFPKHVPIRRLRIDIEDAQRQRIARSIFEIEHEIDAEPDLDRRIEILKSAAERFPYVEHFASSYRAALQKREFVESVVAKARTSEREHRIADALREWKVVQSVHPGYSGLQAELERLEKSKDLQIDYELRQGLLNQIRNAIAASEFAGALHILHTAARRFGGDREFAELRSAAESGSEREQRAGKLLEEAARFAQDHRYAEALKRLDKAQDLNLRREEIASARQQALIEQARSIVDIDSRRAEELLQQASDLAPRSQDTQKLLRTVRERSRRERVTEAAERVRRLQTIHDFDGARRAVEDGLVEDPDAPELLEAAARLKRHGERSLEEANASIELSHTTPASGTRAFLRAAWEKTSALARRPGRDREAKIRYDSPARDRPTAIAETDGRARGEASGQGTVMLSEKTPTSPSAVPPTQPESEGGPLPSDDRVRHLRLPLFAFITCTVAAVITLAVMFPHARKHEVIVPRHEAAVSPVPPAASLPLRVTPPRAEVMLDGAPAPLHDGALAAKPGTYLIEVRSPGYKPFTRSVGIGAGDNTPLDIALVPLPPVIRIETDFQSGSVLLDGKSAGSLEGGQFSLDAPEGSHVIAIAAPDGNRYYFPFSLGHNSSWTVGAPNTLAYGTPVVAAFGGDGARIVCGHSGLAFQLDRGEAAACTRLGTDLRAVSAGDHSLTILEQSRTIGAHTIAYGGNPLLAAFVITGAQFGGLVVKGNQDQFEIAVNGYTSKRPAEEGHWRRLLRPGNYTVVVNKPGFAATPSSALVSIKPGMDTVQQVTFAPVPVLATLRLRSQPGAEVVLNGKSAGTVPDSGVLQIPQIPAGRVEVQVARKGFADAQQTFTLGPGENARTISLQQLGTKLNWTVDPGDAKVSYTAQGDPTRHAVAGTAIELPPGTYHFEASAPGRVPDSATVTVAGGETRTLAFRLGVPRPPPATKENWGGWETQDGWLVRANPGPSFRSLPEDVAHVAFEAKWERQKSLTHWFGGSLNVVFRSANGARSVTFRIGEHGISWNSVAGGERREGRFAVNLSKSLEAARADIQPSGVALTINGTRLAAVGPDLSLGAKPLQFGFIIDPDQVVQVRDIRITAQSSPNSGTQ